jgi:ABC-type polysaccharide/polyol phosphate transport system ATPase subunit
MASLNLMAVSVDFPIYGTQRSLRRALFARATGGLIAGGQDGHQAVVIKALTNVSLQLQDGDRLGLIGHNGAGKSTLLKVMAGIYEPTSGCVFADGHIAPLLDLLPTMDPEDTGYEAIVTAGLLLGMTRREIERKIPEIERFSELGDYLSLPVKTYSTGMSTRLGFSLATTLEPEILLIDEGIGAGDSRFAERATARMKEFIGRTSILVLASHSDELIETICNKAALLRAGRVVTIGPVAEVLSQYHAGDDRADAPTLTAAG